MDTHERNKLLISLKTLMIILAVLYLGFHDRFLPEYLDSPWTFSWAWNLFEHGENKDIAFGETNSSGTSLFQLTPAIIYGAVASFLNWSRGIAIGVSKFFVLVSAVIWFFIVKKLGYKKFTALIFMGIWYAFKDRKFHAYSYFGKVKSRLFEWPDKFVVIETSDFERLGGQADLVLAGDRYKRKDIAEWTYWDGNPIKVYRLMEKN